MEFSHILFDWAIGNCDNHLKNHSFLWTPDWSSKVLSPLYDITCTTIYPELDREMGVSLCASRKIDDVTLSDVLDAAKTMGMPEKIARGELDELGRSFTKVLRQAEQELVEEGFTEASRFAAHIEQDFKRRCEKA